MRLIYAKKRHHGLVWTNHGTSLLEFLIYIALFGVILVAVTRFSLDFLSASAKASAMEQVQRNGRFALDRVALEVREAASVAVASSDFGINPGTLTLSTGYASTDPTVIAISGGALTIKQGSGPVLPLTDSKVTVSNFTLENLAPNPRTQVVRLLLTITSTDTGAIFGTPSQQSFSTTERVRKNDGYSN